MPYPRIVARVKTKNLRAEVWANGVPVVMLMPGDADVPIALPLNEMLSTGRNTLSVTLHSAPLPSRYAAPWMDDPAAASYRGAASLELRLAEYSPDETLEAEPPAIASLDWQGMAEARPVELTKDLDITAPLGPWAWQRATKFAELNDAVRAPAIAYLTSIQAALAAGRFDEFEAQAGIKLDEMSEAYGISSGPVRASLRQVLEDHSVEPWKLLPLEPSGIDLRLVAGGRMLDCQRLDRRHVFLFRNSDTGNTFFLPFMIGLLNGTWKALR
jgi:hypothetical protein